VFPLGRRYRTPNDSLTQACARILMSESEARDRLTSGVYVNDNPDDVTGSIEVALKAVVAANKAERKLKAARLSIPYGVNYPDWLKSLTEQGVIDADEAALLQTASEATRRVIDVDDFPNEVRQGAV